MSSRKRKIEQPNFFRDPLGNHSISFGGDAEETQVCWKCQNASCNCSEIMLLTNIEILHHETDVGPRFKTQLTPRLYCDEFHSFVNPPCVIVTILPFVRDVQGIATIIIDYCLHYILTLAEFRALLNRWYFSPLTAEQIQAIWVDMEEETECLAHVFPPTSVVGVSVDIVGGVQSLHLETND